MIFHGRGFDTRVRTIVGIRMRESVTCVTPGEQKLAVAAIAITRVGCDCGQEVIRVDKGLGELSRPLPDFPTRGRSGVVVSGGQLRES